MAGLITQSAVLLLARKRLERVQKLLRGKLLSGGTVNEIERQVLFLANTALKALNSAPTPGTSFPAGNFTPWLAGGISQFAVMGAIGPELARFAARYAPGQAWLYDTLRSGNPDPGRAQVLARSTDFLLKFCERVLAGVLAQPAGRARNLLLEQMRAYALGHACHVAGAVVSGPFIDAVAFEPGSSSAAPPRQLLSVQAVRGALEEGTSRRVYGRGDPMGADWNGWLPPADQVPAVLFDAYSAAAADTFGPGARVAGSKAFNDRLAENDPPALSAELLRDGYGAYRLLAERGYSWSWGDWLVATLVIFIPPALMFPFSALLPQGRHLRRDGNDAFFADKPASEQRKGERSLFEVMTFPLAANSLVPLGLSLWLLLGSYRGAAKETTFGLINGAVVLVAAISFFATLDTEVPDWVRWLFMFALPLGLEIAHIVYVLKEGSEDPRRWQLAMASISHIVIALMFVLCFVAFLHSGVEGQVDDGLDSGTFWVHAVLWLVIVAVLWLVASALLTLVDSDLPAVKRNDFASGRKQFLRLFDDTTLGVGPLPTPPANLATRLFPAAGLPLLKLSWTGAGDLFVKSNRDSLEFSFSADGSGARQFVAAPLAPMSASEYGALLRKTVRDNAGNFSAQLNVEPFASDEPLDRQLATGAIFADHGDGQATQEAHDTEAAKFRPVPAPGGTPYVLTLAPQAAAAVRVGRNGSLLASGGATALPGAGTITPLAAAGAALVGSADSRFLELFVPGDVIEFVAPGPVQARVVTAVQDDQHLTVSAAFSAFPVAQTYQRRVRDRDADRPCLGTAANDAATFRQLVGTGTRFDETFMPGDLIQALPPGGADPETRTVVVVTSATLLLLDLPFSVAVPLTPAAGVAHVRPGRLSSEGFAYAPGDPTALFAGNSVLDRAADLATLLCLGVSSHLLLDSERTAVGAGALDARHGAVGKAWQVLRNWNLDHRRVNEWRMLVGGGALSEKHGQPDRSDVLQPAMPSALRTAASAGEPISNQLGWAPLFRQWLEMAAQPANDTVADTARSAGAPTQLQLSRAVAYLLDLPSPV